MYNPPGRWLNARETEPLFFIEDIENDGFREIFAITINWNDSLFVSLIRHYPNNEIPQNKFILTLPKSGDKYDYIITPLGLEDNNGDGFAEFLFVINAGFPLQPRAVFAWYVKNDSVYRSPLMGNVIKTKPENTYLQDINGDSIKEIFFETIATDNYKDSIPIPYSDQNSWVMVFTKNLEFLFEPVQIKGAQTDLYHFPYKSGDSILVGVEIYNNRPENPHPTFQFYTAGGAKIKETFIPHFKNGITNRFCKINNRNYIITDVNSKLEISTLNNELDKIDKSLVLPIADYYYHFEDIDADGDVEILVYKFLDEKIYIIRGNLENVTETKINYKKHSSLNKISVAYQNYKPDHFMLVVDGVANYVQYSRNPFYYLNFALALLYYLILVLAFRQLRKSWLSNLKRKQQTEQEMQNLQMQTVLNQLNPHFTFNAINTVGANILNNEPQKAYESLSRLSRLLRKSVDHAFVPYKTLGGEIDFLREYLEVEKSRFGDKLEYEINIQNNVDLNLKVPKMLIQLFVENAIKHGVFHKPEGGKVTVEITQQPECIKIIVQDNGVGRQKAAELGDGRKGKGTLILRNYLLLFKEQFNREITFEIQDIIEEQQVCGTRVAFLSFYNSRKPKIISKSKLQSFQVTYKLPIFDRMTTDKKYIIHRISETVREIDPTAKVILFGSRARGDETPESDWDILILTEYSVGIKDEQRFRHNLIPLELEIGEAFSTFVYYRKDWITRHRITPFYQNVTREGIKI